MKPPPAGTLLFTGAKTLLFFLPDGSRTFESVDINARTPLVFLGRFLERLEFSFLTPHGVLGTNSLGGGWAYVKKIMDLKEAEK